MINRNLFKYSGVLSPRSVLNGLWNLIVKMHQEGIDEYSQTSTTSGKTRQGKSFVIQSGTRVKIGLDDLIEEESQDT